MKDRGILYLLLIIAIFIAGFFVGQYIDQSTSQSALAQTSKPVKIHNLRFKKILYQWLKNYRIASHKDPSKSYPLHPNRIGKLMRQLDQAGYFVGMNTKSFRLDYLSWSRKISYANKEILKTFENQNNYQYYKGNLDNNINHTLWNKSLNELLRNGSDSGEVGSAIVEFTSLDGLSEIRSLTFNRANCQNSSDLLLFFLGNCQNKTLRDKWNLTDDAKNRIYQTGFFSPIKYFSNLYGWDSQEIEIFTAINSVDQVSSSFSPEPKNFVKAMQSAKGILGSQIRNGAAGDYKTLEKLGGVGISRFTKDVQYQISNQLVNLTLSSAQKRLITSSYQFNDSSVESKGTDLRGKVFEKTVIEINEVWNNLQNDFLKYNFLDQYQMRLNKKIKYNGVAQGLCDFDNKIILYDVNFSDAPGLRYLLYTHEAMHVAMPSMTGEVGEPFTDFLALRWIKKNYGYDPGAYMYRYPSFVFLILMNRLEQKIGRENAESKLNNFLTNTNIEPENLDYMFGQGFYKEFHFYFMKLNELQSDYWSQITSEGVRELSELRHLLYEKSYSWNF